MKIGLDVRVFLKEETGIGVYFYNLVNEILKLDNESKFYLFSSSFKDRFKSKLPKTDNYQIKDLKIPVSLLDFFWYRFPLLSFNFLMGKSVDMVHSPLPAIIPGKHKNIVTVHDLCMLDYPDLVDKETLVKFKRRLSKALQKADGIIAVSKFTRDRINYHFNHLFTSKIEVIYHGSDFDLIKPTKPSCPIPDQFFLLVGTIEPRKNLSSLIEAMNILKKQGNKIHLVVAGKKAWDYPNVKELVEDYNLSDQTLFLEYVNRNTLKYLYKNAKALIFPTYYEGFGLPVLEAAYLNLPVICSDIPVLREIFFDYPWYINHQDPEDIADKMQLISNNPGLKDTKSQSAKRIKDKYQWKKTALKTLNLYRRICL